MIDISKLLPALKLSPRYLLPIGFAAGFVLFAPRDVLILTGLANLPSEIKPIVGGVFVGTAAIVLVSWCFSIWRVLADRYGRARKHQKMVARLHNLTDPEKSILMGYVRGRTRTQTLNFTNGVVNGLAEEGIIYLASSMARWTSTDYNIDQRAWSYLNAHPDVLTPKKKRPPSRRESHDKSEITES